MENRANSQWKRRNRKEEARQWNKNVHICCGWYPLLHKLRRSAVCTNDNNRHTHTIFMEPSQRWSQWVWLDFLIKWILRILLFSIPSRFQRFKPPLNSFLWWFPSTILSLFSSKSYELCIPWQWNGNNIHLLLWNYRKSVHFSTAQATLAFYPIPKIKPIGISKKQHKNVWIPALCTSPNREMSTT